MGCVHGSWGDPLPTAAHAPSLRGGLASLSAIPPFAPLTTFPTIPSIALRLLLLLRWLLGVRWPGCLLLGAVADLRAIVDVVLGGTAVGTVEGLGTWALLGWRWGPPIAAVSLPL